MLSYYALTFSEYFFRQATISALNTCEVQVISRRDLYSLLADYPDIAHELKEVAKTCTEANKEKIKDVYIRDIVAVKFESGKLEAIKMEEGV